MGTTRIIGPAKTGRRTVHITTDVESLRRLLASNGNRLFSVRFIKRTNGEMRTMLCRYDDSLMSKMDLKEKRLIILLDHRELKPKHIPLDNLLEIRMKGVNYMIRHAT